MSLIEKTDDRIRQARELVERFNNRFAMDWSNLAECYVHGYIELRVRVRVKTDIWLARIRVIDVVGSHDLDAAHITGSCGAANGGRLDGAQDHEQVMMLALDVERMEGIQGVIPSLVRFEAFNDRVVERGQFPDFLAGNRLAEDSLTLADRKMNVSWFLGPLFFARAVASRSRLSRCGAMTAPIPALIMSGIGPV
jgi:hypothetical protein